jgi:hypothetical protein
MKPIELVEATVIHQGRDNAGVRALKRGTPVFAPTGPAIAVAAFGPTAESSV